MKAFRVFIKGTVQSVGFRPSMYRAFKNLSGWVRSSSKGVEMYLEGDLDKNSLKEMILKNAPPNASVESIEITEKAIEQKVFNKFFIKESTKEKGYAFIPSDLGICDKCASELLDENNRRFLHPFINCTDCGPRFSIVEETPYDRDKTTMKHFKMCTICEQEFNDPLDRRFHAQPISCH